MSQAEFAAVVRKPVDAQAHTDGVEKHIAGLENGFMQICDAMRSCSGLRVVDPALELAAVERPVARTKGGEILLGNMVLQHGRGSHNLENGSWRKLRLNRAIEQRLLPVLVESLPVVAGNAH